MSEPRQSAPTVTAVVVCRNEVVAIEQCLESLLSQIPPPGGLEIVVADGMSDDGTREILSRLQQEVNGPALRPPTSALRPPVSGPSLRVIDNPSRITPCGMNVGIRAARGRWIAIMGAHARYAPDYLVRCLDAAEHTGADNVGGAMICEGQSTLQCAIAAAHHSPFAVGGAHWHNPDYEGPADTVFGGFYNRAVFDRIGLFDESLVRNQDDEFNLRLTRAGGKIWHSPKIRSHYMPRNSLGALFRQYYQYGYWKVRVIQKHKLPASWRHLVPGAFVLTLALLFLLSTFSLLLSALISDLGPLTSHPFQVTGQWSVVSLLAQLSAFSFLLLASSYSLALITASLITASRSAWKLLPLLPFVFPCYHFGYGIGFLRGIRDFMILRRGAKSQFTTLTR